MVTVNDNDEWWKQYQSPCWICGHPQDHRGVAHSEATGDGVTRFQIVDIMNSNGWDWRKPERRQGW